MKTKMLMICLVMCLITPKTEATIVFDDGKTHIINYQIADAVYVRNNFWNEPTTVNLVDGADLASIFFAQESSIVNISGGIINSDVRFSDNSRINISGGIFTNSGQGFTHVLIYGSSQVTISGGQIDGSLNVNMESQVWISGGIITDAQGTSLNVSGNSRVDISGGNMTGKLHLWDAPILTFHGSDFMIDGRLVYGAISGPGEGTLTGILADGTLLNNNFEISGDAASMVFIPEPATIILLGLGSLVLLRKRRTN